MPASQPALSAPTRRPPSLSLRFPSRCPWRCGSPGIAPLRWMPFGAHRHAGCNSQSRSAQTPRSFPALPGTCPAPVGSPACLPASGAALGAREGGQVRKGGVLGRVQFLCAGPAHVDLCPAPLLQQVRAGLAGGSPRARERVGVPQREPFRVAASAGRGKDRTGPLMRVGPQPACKTSSRFLALAETTGMAPRREPPCLTLASCPGHRSRCA